MVERAKKPPMRQSPSVALDERRLKILDAAISLAHGRGFGAVGLREVADSAGVALGTLYKFFKSKEEIISAAVEHQTRALSKRFEAEPAVGVSPLERLEDIFSRLTHALTKRPAYTRGLIATLMADHPELVARISAHEGEMNRLVIAALRGKPPSEVDPADYREGEVHVTFVLRQVWFASLFGWAGGMHSPDEVVGHVRDAAATVLAGAEAQGLAL